MRREATDVLMHFMGVSSESWREAAQWAIDEHAKARETAGGLLRVKLLTLHDDDLAELIAIFTPGKAA